MASEKCIKTGAEAGRSRGRGRLTYSKVVRAPTGLAARSPLKEVVPENNPSHLCHMPDEEQGTNSEDHEGMSGVHTSAADFPPLHSCEADDKEQRTYKNRRKRPCKRVVKSPTKRLLSSPKPLPSPSASRSKPSPTKTVTTRSSARYCHEQLQQWGEASHTTTDGGKSRWWTSPRHSKGVNEAGSGCMTRSRRKLQLHISSPDPSPSSKRTKQVTSAVLDTKMLYSKDWFVMSEVKDKLREKVEYDLRRYREKFNPVSGTYECDEEVLMRRQKMIEIGKVSDDYQAYVQAIANKCRQIFHPRTPNKFALMSRRRFESHVKMWKRKLHYWDDPESLCNMRKSGDSSETCSTVSEACSNDSAISSLIPSTSNTPRTSRSESMIDEDDITVTPLIGDKPVPGLDDRTSSTMVGGEADVDDDVMTGFGGFGLCDPSSLHGFPHHQHSTDHPTAAGGDSVLMCGDMMDDNASDLPFPAH